MARPTLDDKLNAIASLEEKRKTKLEKVRRAELRMEERVKTPQDGQLKSTTPVDKEITDEEDVTEKEEERFAGESSEPERNQQSEDQSEQNPDSKQEPGDEESRENDEENPDDEEENEDEDDEEGDDENEDGDEDENPEENEEGNEKSPEDIEADIDAAKNAAEGEEALAGGEAAIGAAEGAAVAAEGATAAGAATASAPIWGGILAIIAVIGLIMAFVFVVLMVMIVKCNEDSWSGTGARAASTVASWVGVIPEDVCEQLAFEGGSSGGGGASGSWTDTSIVITSAYRPGAVVAGTNRLSAHGRGEGVDIALRNPNYSANDPRLAQILQIARSVGFTPPAGDALDEYTNPTEGATGGHIHLEFNTNSSNVTYCDNTPVKNPPTDLLSIPASLPVSGASDPRLRPCMLDAVNRLFQAVQSNNSN